MVNSGSVSSLINLNVGTNTIAIVVTAQDGTTTQTYTITLTRKAPPPSIVASGLLNSFISCNGIVSNSQSVTVSGTNLLGNINIIVPNGFEISLTSSGNYQTNLSLTPTNGTLTTTSIYIRLSSTATGSISGNIGFASINATTQNIVITGKVNPLPATPTIGVGGPNTFCLGGSVVLTSSSTSGNQWFLNGTPINCNGY